MLVFARTVTIRMCTNVCIYLHTLLYHHEFVDFLAKVVNKSDDHSDDEGAPYKDRPANAASKS